LIIIIVGFLNKFYDAEFTLTDCFNVSKTRLVFGFGTGVGGVWFGFGGYAAHDDDDF
jgi:hypothetical protein